MTLSLGRAPVRRIGPFIGVVAVFLLWFVAALPMGAAVVPSGSVQEKTFHHPALYIPSLEKPAAELGGALSGGWEAELANLGAPSWGGFYDWRAGRWGSLIVSVPLVPGDGKNNQISWGKAPSEGELQAKAWDALAGYVRAHESTLRIDLRELGPANVGVMSNGTTIQIHAPRVIAGIPVRDSGLSAFVSHGNLVLVGLQNWGNVDAKKASQTASSARAVVAEHMQPFAISGYRSEPHLEYVALARGSDLSDVASGAGYDFRLAWVLTPKVTGDSASWEGLIDANSGELLAVQDTNDYAVRRVIGGVYPVSNDGRPPDGIEQPGWPMPHADITGGLFSDPGGVIDSCTSGPIATTLAGQFVRIVDTCGAINESSGAADNIDLGTSTGTDCIVPPGHSPGDTHSSRTGFGELNKQIELAQSYLPNNTWLQQQLRSNMDLNQTCNAFWDGTAVNFFKSSAQCRNTGEMAAIFDHEWGHGLDDNGVNGNISSPGEAIADIRAIIRLDESCIGRGFLKNGVCGGYGDACDGTAATGCSGVRDVDFINHRCNQPHTISWVLGGFTSAQCGGTGTAPACPGGGQTGPCGHETHCEGYVPAETAWDMQLRDFRAAPYNLDSNSALELMTRLMYAAPETLTNWYTCAAGCAAAGTCGCGATGGYLLTLAADDDNGNLADGTPHMTGISTAFTRHEIQCSTVPVADSGCAGAPTAAPVVTATGVSGGVNLSWTPVSGATAYEVYRTDGVFACDFGKVRLGQTASTNFTDLHILDGREYDYVVHAIGATNTCAGPMSACAAATVLLGPDPCVVGNTNTLSFQNATDSVGEAAGNATLNVVLTTSDTLPSSTAATVNFATADGTATAGSDYTAAAGTLSFPIGSANGMALPVTVPITNDALNEPAETFTANLSNPVGGAIGANPTDTVTIVDDDPAPSISIGNASVREGNVPPPTPIGLPVTLSAPSGQTVSANFASADGTATAGTDYQAISGTVVFNPGETAQIVSGSVFGDDFREPDETFTVTLTNPINGTIGTATGTGTILNDDSWPELTHGQAIAADLRAQPGPTADSDSYSVTEKPFSSYEVVVDGTSGDLGAGALTLDRLDSTGALIQSSAPAGSGSSRSLRWENATTNAVLNESVRVQGPGCGTACTADSVYRIRLYDTTAAFARFNNSATQVTIVVLQNLGTDPINGTLWFWNGAGVTALTSQTFTLAPHALSVINTSTNPALAGQSGSVTVSNDGAFGAMAGKAIAVEPATGFTFDTPLTQKPR